MPYMRAASTRFEIYASYPYRIPVGEIKVIRYDT